MWTLGARLDDLVQVHADVHVDHVTVDQRISGGDTAVLDAHSTHVMKLHIFPRKGSRELMFTGNPLEPENACELLILGP